MNKATINFSYGLMFLLGVYVAYRENLDARFDLNSYVVGQLTGYGIGLVLGAYIMGAGFTALYRFARKTDSRSFQEINVISAAIWVILFASMKLYSAPEIPQKVMRDLKETIIQGCVKQNVTEVSNKSDGRLLWLLC